MQVQNHYADAIPRHPYAARHSKSRSWHFVYIRHPETLLQSPSTKKRWLHPRIDRKQKKTSQASSPFEAAPHRLASYLSKDSREPGGFGNNLRSAVFLLVSRFPSASGALYPIPQIPHLHRRPTIPDSAGASGP